MLYAILCYDDEQAISAWTKAQDDAVMARIGAVTGELAKKGRLGPTARLMDTTAATTVRKGRESVVLDGPFAETKEQLLGFFVVECASLEEALGVAKALGEACGSGGAHEVRPMRFFAPGALGERAP
jgi:hypothetical protein